MKMQDTEKNRACYEKKFAHKELGLMSNEFWLKMNGMYYTAFAVANKTVNRQVTWRTRRGDTSIPSNLRTFIVSQSEPICRLSQNLRTGNTKTNVVMK